MCFRGNGTYIGIIRQCVAKITYCIITYNTTGQTLQSWALGTMCYAVCHVCRCCSWARYVTHSATYVTAVVQCLYQLNELVSVPIFFITSKPGAGQQGITNSAKSEVTALTNSDTYVAAVV